MTNPDLPAGQAEGQKGHPKQSNQEWVDQATSQGVPPDFKPPAAPFDKYEMPEGGASAPSAAAAPVQEETAHDTNAQNPLLPNNSEPRIVDTSSDKSDGLDKCPRCGSTEISLRAGKGLLICHFCRHEWAEESIETKHGFDSPVTELTGMIIASGASDIPESTEDVLTLKCQACGAEVVVNTAEAQQSRCHWCRNVLSINQQLPNGAVPDGLLPFSVTKEDAIKKIDEFVKSRKFFAHPKFVQEFKATEVVGVYMPYLIIDANTHLSLSGHGEIKTRSYEVKRGDKSVTLYDADVYHVRREFDLAVDDVVIESSQERANIDTSRNTNNIINAIQPFDVKEAVSYNANYMRGFTSEKRDLDVTGLVPSAYDRVMSIGRSRVNDSIKAYDRRVRWEQEALEVKGTRWIAVYLPVWLYSYYQDKGKGKGLTHYVAVNGRTAQTMGSVPIRQGRLLGISIAIGIVGTVVGGFLDFFIR